MGQRCRSISKKENKPYDRGAGFRPRTTGAPLPGRGVEDRRGGSGGGGAEQDDRGEAFRPRGGVFIGDDLSKWLFHWF